MNKILFGGDYNPQQWPYEIWKEDLALFEEASIDTVTIGVFMWSMIQPNEETYDFSKLDEIMKHLHKAGKKVILATATAAHPAWMAKKYPDVTRVDFMGRKRNFGQRHNSNQHSENYQRLAKNLVRQIATRYKKYNNIVAWHINNEYGGYDYSEEGLVAFRKWLKNKYKTIENLNEKWCSDFWSHIYYDWDEIVFPNAISEHYGDNPNITAYQSLTLDYYRFNSESILQNFIMEKEIIREITPNIPVTTNLMGMYKPLDYFKWGKEIDIVSWDNYPPNMNSQSRMALTHDLMRGVNGGKPFWLMEQTPSMTACRGANPLKPPGVMRLWSYQAVAHGSNTVMFFQMRQNRNQSEKYHGAVIGHSGRRDTRTFKEVVHLGEELKLFSTEFLDSNLECEVGIIFDWDSWWAVEMSDGPTRYINYQEEMIKFHKQFYDRNIATDIISLEDKFEKYKLIIAPYLHMVPDAIKIKIKIEKFIAEGGIFVTTCMSGIVDEFNNAYLMDKPGIFQSVSGIRIDETDAQEKDCFNSIVDHHKNIVGKASIIFDIIQLEHAEAEYYYTDNFYAETPVVTKNQYGNGVCWYIGSILDEQLMNALFDKILSGASIASIETPDNVEISIRKNRNTEWVFIMNHNDSMIQFNSLWNGKDLLSNKVIHKNTDLKIEANDLIIIENRK